PFRTHRHLHSFPTRRSSDLDEAIHSRGFKRLFSAARLKTYRESFEQLEGNRQVCATTVALPQNLLLADRRDMDHIIEAVRKIQADRKSTRLNSSHQIISYAV